MLPFEMMNVKSDEGYGYCDCGRSLRPVASSSKSGTNQRSSASLMSWLSTVLRVSKLNRPTLSPTMLFARSL